MLRGVRLRAADFTQRGDRSCTLHGLANVGRGADWLEARTVALEAGGCDSSAERTYRFTVAEGEEAELRWTCNAEVRAQAVAVIAGALSSASTVLQVENEVSRVPVATGCSLRTVAAAPVMMASYDEDFFQSRNDSQTFGPGSYSLNLTAESRSIAGGVVAITYADGLLQQPEITLFYRRK